MIIIVAYLVKEFLPVALRMPVIVAYLKALAAPVKSLNIVFLAEADVWRRMATYNAQTIVLESALNWKFSSTGIYIENLDISPLLAYDFFESEAQPYEYIYFESEGEPYEFDYFESEFLDDVDYIVWVPVALTFDAAEMAAFIRIYNAAGKRFKIDTYS